MMYKWEVLAMTAVIYARYSTDSQREESIEGQIRECTAYAEKNGFTVVKHYIDRAISAKTDNRPQFQQMIKDSERGIFDVIIVWKLDRFARNRYDSARYKTQLKRNGVKLVSATEVISAGPEGIILESVLEGYAEYYSADLSEKVVRGMTENALKGIYNGGTIPFGYMIDETRHYQPDPLLAPYVEQTFQKYADGATMTDLRDWLKAHNIKNSMGGEMSYNTIQRMLSNRRYIGELRLRDVVQPNAIPALVSEELFNKVQEKLAKNKKAPARHKAEESYLLTTKLYCGKCGALMFGESGVSHTGKMYTYYKCAAAKKKKTCDKKAVRKQWLEDLVVNETMKLVEDDASMNAIIAKVMELQNQESTDLPIYEKQLKETEVGITNMLNAIQMGILTSSTKERLEALEEQRKELQARIAEERLAKPKMKEEFVRFWLLRFRKLDMTQPEQRQALVDTFINAIYLYDDKVLITFNYKEGTETVAFGEAVKAEKSSDMSARGAPDIERQIVRFGVFSLCRKAAAHFLHTVCTFAREEILGEQGSRQFSAFVCVHQPDGFKDLPTGDFCCRRLFVLPGLGCCRGQVLRIEVRFDLLGQLQPGFVLCVGVGVHEDGSSCMTGVALHRLEVAIRLQELVGGTGVTQTVEHDLFKLWMLRSPQAIPLCQQLRCDGQAVREPEQLPTVAVLLWGVLLVLFELFKPCKKLIFQGLSHIQDAVGLLGLWLFQDEGGLAALTPVREGVVDLIGVEFFQSVLVGSLHGLVHQNRAASIRSLEVQITRLQAENFTLTEREDHAQMHRQMQGRVLDGLQRCQHGFFVPDGAFLDVDLGRITGQGNLVDQVPFHRIGECSFQQRVDLVDRGAGQQPLLLLLGKFLLHTVHILPAGCLGKGGIELLNVVGSQFLHLPFPDIRHDEILHHRYGLGVGLGGPLVLGGLDRDPFVQHLLHRHGVGDEECAVQQFFLDRDLSLLRLLLGLETFPSLAGLAGMVFVLVTDGVGISALHNRCHRLPP